MANREGADIQEARKYVTSKQNNINSANNGMTNSSSSSIYSGMSNSSNSGITSEMKNISASTVSSSRPMSATIEEARQYNQQHGSGSSMTSSTSSGSTGSFDLSSGAIQQEIKEARKATTNPSSGSMQ